MNLLETLMKIWFGAILIFALHILGVLEKDFFIVLLWVVAAMGPIFTMFALGYLLHRGKKDKKDEKKTPWRGSSRSL